MERIRQGIPWNEVGTDSFGNGGAMRIAPIGCFYHSDLQAVQENAILSARITHNHPEGLAGAVAQATAVALAFQHGLSNDSVEAEGFVDRISTQVSSIYEGFAESLEGIKSISQRFSSRPTDSEVEVIEAIGNRYGLSLRAIESVPAAIGAFLLTNSFRDAVVLAVNLGGDTDTIGAMAGAVAGAYYGLDQIPQEWIDPLENGVKGRDYTITCVKQIVSSMPPPL
jgi:poly(ADP-ribose) glycohydrolase ARH3